MSNEVKGPSNTGGTYKPEQVESAAPARATNATQATQASLDAARAEARSLLKATGGDLRSLAINVLTKNPATATLKGAKFEEAVSALEKAFGEHAKLSFTVSPSVVQGDAKRIADNVA